jgi:hypothetical protein
VAGQFVSRVFVVLLRKRFPQKPNLQTAAVLSVKLGMVMRKIYTFVLLLLFSANTLSEEKYSYFENGPYRFDEANSYLVLIPAVDLSSSEFKTNIEEVLSSLASKAKTKKFSARIFDNNEALNYYLSSVVKKGAMNKSGEKSLEAHLVAVYTGELSTNWAKYTLDFFPSAFTENSKVGKYVDTIEFEPKI